MSNQQRGESENSRPVLLTEPRSQEIAMPSGIVVVSAGETEQGTGLCIKWCADNGLDARSIKSPCVVDFDRRVIVADHMVLDEHLRTKLSDAGEFLTDQQEHPLIIDPPEEIVS